MQAAGFVPQNEHKETQLLNDSESSIQLSTDTEGQSTIESSEWKVVGKSHISSSKKRNNDADRTAAGMSTSSSIQDSISLLTDASDDTIVTENTLGDDMVSIEQRRKCKEKKSINKRLIAIDSSHEELEQWKKDHPLQLEVAKSMASISSSPEFKTDILVINLMEAELKEKESQSHMEIEKSKPTQEPAEQLKVNAPGGP